MHRDPRNVATVSAIRGQDGNHTKQAYCVMWETTACVTPQDKKMVIANDTQRSTAAAASKTPQNADTDQQRATPECSNVQGNLKPIPRKTKDHYKKKLDASMVA